MGNLSTYAKNAVLEALLRGGSYTGGLVYLALATGSLLDDGSGPELTDSGYVRKVCGNPASTGFGVPHATQGSTTNAAALTFPAIVDAQVAISHFGLFDALDNGNLLFHNALPVTRTMKISNVPHWPAGKLTVKAQGAFSDYAEALVVNALVRGQSINGGLIYLGLFTEDPTDAGTGAELTDSAYVRKKAGDPASAGFSVPADGVTSNAQDIEYPAIADAQVEISHWGAFDAPNGGNLILHAPLTNPQTLDVLDVPRYPVGTMEFTLD